MARSVNSGASDRPATPRDSAGDTLATRAARPMMKTRILREDGRYLIFYSFPGRSDPVAAKEDIQA